MAYLKVQSIMQNDLIFNSVSFNKIIIGNINIQACKITYILIKCYTVPVLISIFE